MAMETKDKYITPKTEVLELQTEGIIADSHFDSDSGAAIDDWCSCEDEGDD